MQARPKFRMTRKLQLPRTAGPSRYWLGPKMWLLRSTGWSLTTSDKPPRIACTHIGGTTWWLHMSAAKLKLALSSRSRFCTLTFTVSLRFEAVMGQVFSIKFTWKQCLSFHSARTFASLKQYSPWQSVRVSQGRGKLPPGPRLRAVRFPISSLAGVLPQFLGWFFSRFQPIKLQKQKPCWEIRLGSTGSTLLSVPSLQMMTKWMVANHTGFTLSHLRP